ncbi:MAG: hypothetical protein AABZ14_09340 [Candidatus Margulisiibacteriota bacterium]
MSSTIPISTQPSPIPLAKPVDKPGELAAASPKEPLPQTAIPPLGTVGRPPIDNITTQGANRPVPIQGSMAETVAVSQVVSEQVQMKKKEEDEKIEEEVSEENDEEILKEMHASILGRAKDATKKIHRSAFKYMYQKTDWLNKETVAEAEKFFTQKVPDVIAGEIGIILEDTLGLGNQG